MIALFSVLLAFLAPQTNALISGDLNCTNYNGTFFVYSPAATACSNAIGDSACAVLYPVAVAADGYPAPGNNAERPRPCYTTAAATPAAVVQDMKNAAMSSCAKTCGLCCQTSAYNCPNVAYPRLNCATITASQCLSSQWRTIIAVDCPSACGFCNEGGCVDAVVDCANDRSICGTVGMQDFVNTYCQKTCQRCASSTTASSGTGTCSSYVADSSTNCRSWAANGFCTNTFYTVAQRRAYCGTSCRIC
ncbi:hypothetical protein CAEBREN_25733 [Caenorhabditis brenneri]|uniref:ShKT domain-containing protein n=1 Tax=Caenorhabditis brenneri TaxID=135651 RepID=G0PEP7_CAEBE|nr:hypothetical protein CAEBREN_25733 [Caenorhabditis brenneri]